MPATFIKVHAVDKSVKKTPDNNIDFVTKVTYIRAADIVSFAEAKSDGRFTIIVMSNETSIIAADPIDLLADRINYG